MITPEEFSNLFLNNEEKEKKVLFVDTSAIGFSITKEYPETGLIFKPLKNQKGEFDSVALIKIYFRTDNINDFKKVPIYASISLVSRYLLNGRFRYHYEDQESPSLEDLQGWDKAPKPIDLIEIEHTFDTTNNKIYSKKGTEVNPKVFVENLFKEHIKTAKRIAGLPFRMKVSSRDFFSNKLLLISKSIHWICKVVFLREINQDNRSHDTIAYELYLKPVPHSVFILKQQRELNIFGTEIPVSKYSVIITSFLFLSFYTLVYIFYPSFKENFDHLIKENTFITPSIIIVWFVFFDNWLPHILLFISNNIIRLANNVRNWKIRV